MNSSTGRAALDVLDCNGDISLGGPSLDSYISYRTVGQFLVEWFLVTSACHSLALSVQTIHVACWQHLPSGAAEDWPDADLLPVCWRRRGGEPFGLGGEGEDERSNEEGRRASWQLLASPDIHVHKHSAELMWGFFPSHIISTVWVKRPKCSFMKLLLSLHFQVLFYTL